MSAPPGLIVDDTNARPPRPKRWIPVSLRIFVAIMVLLFVVGALWIGVPAYRQHAAIRRLERAGGSVHYIVLPSNRLRRNFLTRRIEPLVEVGVINFQSPTLPISDNDLAGVEVFGELRDLDVHSQPVSDAGLAHIRQLTQLRGLNLAGTNITDAGLEHLKGLTNLQTLNLTGTRVSNAGLRHISQLTGLKRLNLTNTDVTDAGLKHLQGLTKLTFLHLTGTPVTDAGLVQLKTVKSLRELNVKRTAVTATGKAELEKALPRLAIDRVSHWMPEE